MNLLRFDSEEAWVSAVASLWRDRLRANPHLRICLPSGNTPKRIFAEMGRAVAAGWATFQHAEVFALDDYGGLAPDDQGRCVNMLRRLLLAHIDLPQYRFHFIDTDAPDLDQLCRDYDAAIGAGFDLTLLGIGLNGHLGLNEPGTSPDSTTHRVRMHESTIKASAGYLTHANLPTWGVGVGLKHLLGSKEVWLLANGAAKADIVQRLLKGPAEVSVPASLMQRHPNCFLMVDAAAGALV